MGTFRNHGFARRLGTVALVYGTLCASACGATDAAVEPVTACFIEGRSGAGGTFTLEAVLEAGVEGFEGNYRLSVETAGAGGRSASVQAGNIRLAAGERRGLGLVAVTADQADVTARLTARSVTGEECVARY